MRKFLTAPVKMGLSDSENIIYQQVLKHVTDISLNLMAVKVEERPDDFTSWCRELHRLCADKLNYDLLDPEQLPVVKKLQTTLEKGVSGNQLKMLRITPWPMFAGFIEEQKEVISLDERLRLLNFFEPLKETPLQELSNLDRLAFIGKHTSDHAPSTYDFDAEFFVSTKTNRLFQQQVEQRASEFADALSHIPLMGDVTLKDYQAFVSAYKAIFALDVDRQPSTEKAPLIPATRLLAMRRPDQFVAMSATKFDVLCSAFGCTRIGNYDFDGYWYEVIATMRTCPWWMSPEPEDANEQQLWKYRAALVEVFHFADQYSPQSSNYLRLKERIANGSKATSQRSNVARKRTKESAEQIVDHRLQDEELPEFIKNKRDALIESVKNGKSVDEAIKLYQAIFG